MMEAVGRGQRWGCTTVTLSYDVGGFFFFFFRLLGKVEGFGENGWVRKHLKGRLRVPEVARAHYHAFSLKKKRTCTTMQIHM